MESRALLLSAMLLGSLLGPSTLSAQSRDANSRFTSQFLPAGRELKMRLGNVSEAVQEERYAEAAGVIGEFFLDEELEDYFVDTSGKSSLKGDALKLLLSLPPAGRESYELQFGADARMLLTAALEEQSDAKLGEVMRKYLHTKAGNQAAVIWSRRQLDAGRPLAAAVMLERVAKTSLYAKEYEPELSLLSAVSWRMAGQSEQAKQALLTLKALHTQKPITLAGRKLTLFTDDEQALAWLDQLMGDQSLVAQNEVSQWLMHRGNPTRNAISTGSPPVPTLRWHKFLGRDENDDQILARKAKEYQSNAIAAIPTVSPLVIHNTVLMRTPERLMAVDLNTGKFVWRYPWDDVADGEAGSRAGRAPSAELQHERELMQRVWEDRAYGQLASDGESVFLLDELGYTGMGYVPSMIIRPGGARQPNPGQPTSHNKLVALSLAKQGKLRWTVGGATGEDEPKLAGAFFLGVPLPYDGSLYALIELNGELRLVVLDPATGKVEWSQQLAHIENVPLQILGDSTRRLSGATPSLASGILICPTSACSVVAIDLTQRKLLWGHQYEPSATIRQQNAWVGYVQPSRPVGSYWLDSTVAIADGKVILTPTDSDYLICLDLVTGKEAWKPIKRIEGLADMLYVACVDDGKIVLVGRTRVTAINLSDGQPAWSEAIALTGEMPSGRGFQSGHDYYLPTTLAQLLKIDLRTGKVVQRTPTGRVLGNLVPHGTQLVSQQHDGVSSFFQSESLRTLLVDRLKANPADPEALAQQAQLQLFDGQRDEALGTLRKAYGLDRTNDDTRALLVRTLLEALERDFDSYQALAAEIEPLLDQPQHKRDFLRLKAQGLQNAGDSVAAFEAYAALAGNEIIERPDSTTSQHMVSFDPQVRIRFDRWVQTRLQDLYTTADANTQAKMNDALIAQLKLLPQAPTVDQYSRVVQYFGWHPLADQARVELATLRLESGDALTAEALLNKFAKQGDSEIAGRAVAVLAAVYEKVERTEYAAACYLRLRDHFSETKVRREQTGSQLFDAAAKSMTVGPRLIQGGWPTGAVEMSEGSDAVSPSVGYGAVQRLYPMPIAEARGVLDDGSALVLARQQLILRDRLGAEWTQTSLARQDGRPMTTTQPATTHAHLLGHLAIVSVGQELLAFNMLDRGQDAMEAQLWRHDLIPSGVDSTGGIRPVRSQTVPFGWTLPRTFATVQPDSMIGSVACLSDRAVCFTRSRDVVCVDPLTGDTLWERTLPEAGCELFGDDEVLFAIPPRKEEAIVLSVADGRELGKRQVGAIDFRWSTHGRNVLVCKQDGRDFAARLYDAWSEKTLWEGRFAFGSRGTLIGRDEMAMLQNDGKFVIVSLVDGQVKLDTKLEAEPRLMYIHVLRSAAQYFVQLETIVDQKELLPRTTVQPIPGGDTSKLVTGRLYAFDRATMKPSWPAPAYISQYGLPLDQPSELPILTFLRQTVPTADAPSREARTSVLVLDRRDGRILLERDGIRIPQTNVYQQVGSLAEQSITLTLMTGRGAASGKIFTFKLTEKPTPPAPPGQTGAMSSMLGGGSSGNIFQAIGRAIGEGTRPETPDDFLPRQLAPGAPLPPGFPPGLVPRPR